MSEAPVIIIPTEVRCEAIQVCTVQAITALVVVSELSNVKEVSSMMSEMFQFLNEDDK